MKTSIVLFSVFSILMTAACIEKKENRAGSPAKQGPTSEGSSSGGGGFADESSLVLLKEATDKLATRIENANPLLFKGFPQNLSQQKIAEIIRNVKKEINRSNARYGRELIFDYDKNEQQLYALSLFFRSHASVPVNFLSKEEKARYIHEIQLRLLHELAHLLEIGETEETDSEARKFGSAFLQGLELDQLDCEMVEVENSRKNLPLPVDPSVDDSETFVNKMDPKESRFVLNLPDRELFSIGRFLTPKELALEKDRAYGDERNEEAEHKYIKLLDLNSRKEKHGVRPFGTAMSIEDLRKLKASGLTEPKFIQEMFAPDEFYAPTENWSRDELSDFLRKFYDEYKQKDLGPILKNYYNSQNGSYIENNLIESLLQFVKFDGLNITNGVGNLSQSKFATDLDLINSAIAENPHDYTFNVKQEEWPLYKNLINNELIKAVGTLDFSNEIQISDLSKKDVETMITLKEAWNTYGIPLGKDLIVQNFVPVKYNSVFKYYKNGSEKTCLFATEECNDVAFENTSDSGTFEKDKIPYLQSKAKFKCVNHASPILDRLKIQ